MTTESFTELTTPFADTIEMAGAPSHDFEETPHFVFVLNNSDESANMSFPASQSLVVSANRGYLFFVNQDGYQILVGPTQLEDS